MTLLIGIPCLVVFAWYHFTIAADEATWRL
jgi:hypothetical protein